MPASRPRNHVIDVARALSVIVVVVFHTLLYRIRLDDSGVPHLEAWAAPHSLYPLTWVFMIMPLFFVAGGFAHTLTSDRMHREGASYGHWLASRGRRLVGPLGVFVMAMSIVFSAAAWLGWTAQAIELSRQLMQLLWFITVYLVIVAIAPRMVRLHDRYGVLVMIVLAAVAACIDAWSFAVGRWEIRNLNMLVVWPLVHQFGIAYQRGWWRTGPARVPWASLIGGALGVAVLVLGLGYPPTSVGFADLPIANIQPPTLAMGVLAVAQCGLLGLVERSGVLRQLPPRMERRLAILNTVMVSVYLWHIPCIVVAGASLLALAGLFPAAAPVLVSPVVLALASLAVVSAAVPLLGFLEMRLIPPLGDEQDTGLAVLAFLVLALGTYLVWQEGAVIHPSAPGSTAGVLAIALGLSLMGRAANHEVVASAG